jgi:hypothetical protein
MSVPYAKLPAWVDYGLIPLINLIVAFLVAGLVVLAVGESPLRAAALLIEGAFGYGEGIGFTLYYATNFIFHRACRRRRFSLRLVQHRRRGPGLCGGPRRGAADASGSTSSRPGTSWCSRGDSRLRTCWCGLGLDPGWLQAKRGSHVVITTIMFNFIASSLMVYVLVDVLKPAGSMAPQTRTFADGGQLPRLDWLLASVGLDIGGAPFNMSFLLALVAAFVVWVVIWRTRSLATRSAPWVTARGRRVMPASAKAASSSSP